MPTSYNYHVNILLGDLIQLMGGVATYVFFNLDGQKSDQSGMTA